MSETSAEPRRGAVPLRLAGVGLVTAFGASLFLSALLLFSVQPLFAKLVLPRLGGTPAVWSVAMVFFQAALLAGYAYAHALVRFAGRAAIFIHTATLALGLLWLPVGIANGFETPPGAGVPLWLLALFAASVGAPFFAVAANAPLLQAWFSRTGHAHANDPYFLYGTSNIGSFVALLAYPTVLESLFTLTAQSRLWALGYLVLMAAVIACGATTRRPSPAPGLARESAAAAVSWSDRLQWIGWAFLPSALLVAVTAHLSTNVAAAPFLWVLPLAVFLLSFVITFQRRPIVPPRTIELMVPAAVTGAFIACTFPASFDGLTGIGGHLLAFLVIACAWHGRLVAQRPAAARLTDFYLCMSIGGVLGGAFTSLAAPLIFNWVLEFPLLLALSLLALPEVRRALRTPIGKAAAVAALAIVMLSGGFTAAEQRHRSFFGVLSTEISEDGRFRLLYHGTTLHGAERLEDVAGVGGQHERPEPLTYYAPGGPLADGIGIERRRRSGGAMAMSVVGLGAGSLACYSEPGDTWRFFEIDPAVIRMARDPRSFTFLSSCAPDAAIVQGDARLMLAREPDGSADVLVIDAFSSDSIPVHLLTREAFSLYAQKLKPDGVILLHISNRFLELSGVVAATAAADGLAGATILHNRSRADTELRQWLSSNVVVLARRDSLLAPYRTAGWKPLSREGVDAWTDDYSNIVAAMLRRKGLM